MHRLIAMILSLSASIVMANPVGYWTGAIDLPGGIKLNIEVTLTDTDEALEAKISIPQQGARHLPLSNVSGDQHTLYFELEAPIGTAVFDGKLISPHRVEGKFTQGVASGTFHLDRGIEEKKPAQTIGEPVSLDVEGGTLHGSLVVPENVTTPPVVLIISGSGPTDRDGNTPLFGSFNNSLRMLAQALGQHGIASLRYDKRGIGESMPGVVEQSELRIEDYMNDAAAWIQYLSDVERFGDVFVAGHSEGALIGMVAANDADIAGFVSIAGVGRSSDKLFKEQLTRNIPASDLARSASEIIDMLAAGKTVSDVPAQLALALDVSVQPFLISLFRYEPADEIGKLSVPILVVQGTTDIQVSQTDAEMLARAAKDSSYVTIPGMNHILKPAEGNLMAQVPVYGDPDLPLHEDLIEPIVEFIQSN